MSSFHIVNCGLTFNYLGKIEVPITYTENFYTVRNKWPSKLTLTNSSTIQQELYTDDY